MSQSAEPVSWLLIERGWKVVTANGAEVGKVEETAGDSKLDIFNGLTVATGLLGRPRYVPAEKVAEITEGQVRLTIDGAVAAVNLTRSPRRAPAQPRGHRRRRA
jgi:hypothetical protein